MPAPFTPQQALATPESWYERTDVPQLEQYNTLDEWQAALEDFLAVQNATPAFPGLSSASPNYGKSQAQIDAETLNRRVKYHDNGPGLGVALQNQINQGMPIIQSAYGAVDSDGTPIVADPLIAMLEALGIAPTADQVKPPLPPPGPNMNEDTGQTDAGRYSDWWNSGTPPAAPPTAPRPGGGDGTGRPPLAPPPDPVGDPGNYPGSGSQTGGPNIDPRLVNAPPVEPIGDPGISPGTGNTGMDEARMMAMTMGPVSTIDPRYPDWLLLLNRRRRQPVTPVDALGY